MSSAGTEATLIYMANQIAGFFASQGGGDQALRAADHIGAFWDPRMRRMILEHLDHHDGEGLSPLALEAIRIIKANSAKKVGRAMAAAGERSPGHDQGDDAG